MTFPTSGPAAGSNPLGQPPDFSLFLGGPLFQLLRRARLTDDALLLLRQRIVVIALFAWLPLLLLSALEGQLLNGGVAVPFLLDLETHIRFLVALPLLIAAELVVHRGCACCWLDLHRGAAGSGHLTRERGNFRGYCRAKKRPRHGRSRPVAFPEQPEGRRLK